MQGYKVFHEDWKCRDFQYEVGKSYEMPEEPRVCDCGFHYCTMLADCFNYYSFDPKNKVAEVDAYGQIDTDGVKSCTNKIRIVREISWEECLRLVNTGLGNSGYRNSGNRNSGDWNSGNRNSGNRNSGDWNSGDWNSGNWNSGNRNSGDWNSGDWNSGNGNSGNGNSGDGNSGNRNSGNRNSGNGNSGNGNSGNRNSGNWNSGNGNSGDWNRTCFSNGCFNTEEPKIYMFNKPSNWTYRDWLNSMARQLFEQIDDRLLEWIDFENMTEAEKEAHKEAETTGGYLKELDKTDCYKLWWDGLKPSEKNVVKKLPNFDADIFKEICGIEVSE